MYVGCVGKMREDDIITAGDAFRKREELVKHFDKKPEHGSNLKLISRFFPPANSGRKLNLNDSPFP